MMKDMDREKIGQFILEQRKKLNLTQSELAEQLHVTSQAVSKWENGRGIPDIELLKELSNYFQVDLQEILNGEIKTKEKGFSKTWLFCVLFLFLLFLGIWWLFPKQDNSFQFSSLESQHDSFSLKGVVAYNKEKKSLFLSDVKYLSDNEELYYGMICTLYEQIGETSQKISACGNDSLPTEGATISDLLSMIEFRLDDYSCTCEKNQCHDLYLDIRLLNQQNQYISYEVPLEVLQCNSKRSV